MKGVKGEESDRSEFLSDLPISILIMNGTMEITVLRGCAHEVLDYRVGNTTGLITACAVYDRYDYGIPPNKAFLLCPFRILLLDNCYHAFLYPRSICRHRNRVTALPLH